jgi:hypothetical protein
MGTAGCGSTAASSTAPATPSTGALPATSLQPDVNHFAAACLVSDTTGYALLWQGHTSLVRTLDAGRIWTTVGSFGG